MCAYRPVHLRWMSVLLLVDMFGKVALMFLFEPTCFHVGVFLLGLCHPHPGAGGGGRPASCSWSVTAPTPLVVPGTR